MASGSATQGPGGAGGGFTFSNAAAAAQSAGTAAVLAGFVSFGVAKIMLQFVEQKELLTAFAALGAVIMVGVRRLYEVLYFLLSSATSHIYSIGMVIARQ